MTMCMRMQVEPGSQPSAEAAAHASFRRYLAQAENCRTKVRRTSGGSNVISLDSFGSGGVGGGALSGWNGWLGHWAEGQRAERLIWRHAMQMGKDGAVEELLDDLETSRGLYAHATRLLEYLRYGGANADIDRAGARVRESRETGVHGSWIVPHGENQRSIPLGSLELPASDEGSRRRRREQRQVVERYLLSFRERLQCTDMAAAAATAARATSDAAEPKVLPPGLAVSLPRAAGSRDR